MLKSNYFIKFAVILACLISSTAATVYADVKIKTRQTMSGQTSENTTYIKGKRQRSEMMNGQMITITQCDLRRDVQLMPQGKVYMINPFDNGTTNTSNTTVSQTTTKLETGGTVTMTVTTKDTGERKQMFGYTARHLIITTETVASADACAKGNSKMQTDGWYIDAAWYFECDRGYSNGYMPRPQKAGCQDKFNVKQIGTAKRGYPLYEKMTMFDESGGETYSFTNEVVELSQATLDAALFEIPQDYREVKDSTQLYASMSSQSSYSNNGRNDEDVTPSTNSRVSQNVQNMSQNASTSNIPTTVGAKKEGVIRIGLAAIKTGSIGEGLNAAELAGAVQNTLGEYLKGTNIELVQLEAKLPAAIESEARQKECDYVLNAQVSHKKGGGGFGMFSKIAPVIGNAIPVGSISTNGGQIAAQTARTTVYTAGSFSGNVKAKDELTFDVNLKSAEGATALGKQFKAKAKSNGEDVISPLVEQVATAILSAVSSSK